MYPILFQIADLDDRLRQTQDELMETSRQLHQQQQLAQRQQLELQAATAKVEELETVSAGAVFCRYIAVCFDSLLLFSKWRNWKR